MKATIQIITQGVRGTQPKSFTKQGMALINVDRTNDNPDNNILVDSFLGSGSTYKNRNKSLIHISKNKDVIFSGDFDLLCKILKENSNE